MQPHSDADDLRRCLARAGVPLFVPGRKIDLGVGELSGLIRALASQSDPRLLASLPCLIVRHAETTPPLVGAIASRIDRSLAVRLGLLHRCARALAISRSPDLEHVLGHAVLVARLPIEPRSLPEPEAELGELFLAVARECDATGLVGDVEDTFDTWLRQLEVEHVAVVDA